MKRSFSPLLILLSISLLFILFSCQKEKSPVVHKNHKPKIKSLTTNTTTLLINTKTTFTCIAIDEDKDNLKISWSSKKGKFYDGNVGEVVKWISPSTTGTDTIIVTVSDGKETVQGEIEIIVGTVPTIPLLVKPANGISEVALTTQLIWDSVKDAKSYTLQVSTNNSFSKFPFHQYELKNNKKKITGLISNTIYYWRIKSKNSFGSSSWSSIFSFKTVAPPQVPTLLSPNNSTQDISLTPTLIWNALNNASSYTLQVSVSNSFSSFIFNQSGLTNTSQQISGLNYFTTYYWRVSATNTYGTSDWSIVWNYSTIGTVPNAPFLLTPNNGLTNVSLTTKISWDESTFATSYTLQVSENSSFTNFVFNQSGLTTTSISISGLSNTKIYYWRINATNSYGTSGWSNTWSFRTLLTAPELSLPINEAIDISPYPTFSWDSIEEAESYTLQISMDSSFSSFVYNESKLTAVSRQISGLTSFTKYYWRVNAENSFGPSVWSDTRSFTVSSYFYKGLTYGNQAIYHPLYVILNGGFDMIQVGNKRDIKNFPYKIAITNIWRNISDPFTPINNYGWWDFISDQVLPLSLNKNNAQFWPNYTLHLIGGGMEYAALKEWYEFHKYPYPQWLSALTVMSYHFINEVAENGNRIGDDVDPIADLYIFDIGGILLFTSESVKRFFSEDLNLADWSQQPSFSLRNGELHNNGQFFSVKWKLPFLNSWHAFYYFGTNGVGGLSYKFEDGSALSVGAGLATGDLILLDERTNKKTLGLVGNFGVFYDKNNSLLASLSVTIKTDYMININIYPGVIKLWDVSPGLWGAYSQDGNVILGFTVTWFPFGFAYSVK